MNLRLALLALVFPAGGIRADEALPLFNGRLTVGQEQRFVIVSPAGRVSSWLRLGETFDGCVLRAYDVKTGELMIERAGVGHRLRLVPDALTLNAPADSPEILAEAESALEQVRRARMLDKIVARGRRAQLDRVEEMLAAVRKSELEPEELRALKRRLAEAIVAVLDTAEVRAEVEQRWREVFSPEELGGLAAFYNAPFAQKLEERQDEVISNEEATALAEFRASPLGRKLAEHQAGLDQKVSAVMAQRVQAEVKVREIVEERSAKTKSPTLPSR